VRRGETRKWRVLLNCFAATYLPFSVWAQLYLNKLIPCADYLCDSQGTFRADHVIRLEEFAHDVHQLCDELGIPRCELSHENKSKRGDYREYFSPKLAEVVRRKIGKDVELFGYQF
jgi:hypothetical protein